MYIDLEAIFNVPTHENIVTPQDYVSFRNNSSDLLGFDAMHMLENFWGIDVVIFYLHHLEVNGDIRKVLEFTSKFIRCLYYANGRVSIYKELSEKYLNVCVYLANTFLFETEEKVNEVFYDALQSFYLESVSTHLYF